MNKFGAKEVWAPALITLFLLTFACDSLNVAEWDENQWEEKIKGMAVSPMAELADHEVQYHLQHLKRFVFTFHSVAKNLNLEWNEINVLCIGEKHFIPLLLYEVFEVKSVSAVSLDSAGTQTLRTSRGNIEMEILLCNAEREALPFEAGSFDFVICLEMIEHASFDPMRILIEANRVMKRGANLVLTTPNSGSLASAWKALSGKSPYAFSQFQVWGEEDESRIFAGVGHFREYTWKELQDMGGAAGLDVVHHNTFDPFDAPVPDQFFRILEQESLLPPKNYRKSWNFVVYQAKSLPEYIYFEPLYMQTAQFVSFDQGRPSILDFCPKCTDGKSLLRSIKNDKSFSVGSLMSIMVVVVGGVAISIFIVLFRRRRGNPFLKSM